MKESLIKAALFVVVAVPMCANALVYSGSNFKGNEYISMDAPPLEPIYNDKDSINEHRKKVMEYITKTERYVENADSDIKRVESYRFEAIQRARLEAEKYHLKTNLPDR
ncbi:TPA: hypothetical protein K8N54_000726 [Serratia marcescens]|uniref:Uncharacterized protein n=1 Tax=Serratia marcescens SM39 TaxID=1334564 RepID=A0AAT9EST8_SERMA|nr:hypothetical protein [Serratia marcescens]WAZ04938.1 hypothetical protein O3T12_17245 [Serratia marcescens]BAO33303.1 hypothetical protein SM39_1256 [Serratia marcescens SM39]BCZ40526.1 hypothetical protein SMGES_18520 [Serratia marcescens]HBI6266046.1 hypothetical protein [Serratia marcescens]HBI6948809.1 hypothetical protein [Serratia marcescens]